LRQQNAELEALGAAVYAVSFEQPGRLRAYIRANQIEAPVLADPHRRVYRAYGLARGLWWRIYGPRVLWGYLRRILRGDTLQQGGDFVIDPNGVVSYARPQRRDDRPPVAILLRELERASTG